VSVLLESAGSRSIIAAMNVNAVRIVTSPDPLNGTGFAATVWRTSNGSTWERGGSSHASSASHAESDARRWLLNDGEDEHAMVLPVLNIRVLEDARALGALLDASLTPIGEVEPERVAA